MHTDPLAQLREWLGDALGRELRAPTAAVLSTTGLDGCPNARNVAIKDVTAHGVVVTGPLQSRKGRELAADPRCALTCWWDSLGRQVRVQGVASVLPREQARAHFDARSRDARIVATVSRQGEVLVPGELEEAFAAAVPAEMPEQWGGWTVVAHRIEFMEFSDSRFHTRMLHTRDSAGWTATLLQP